VDRLPGPDGASHGVSSAYVKHSSAPLLRRECRWHRTVKRRAADGVSFAEPESAVAGFAEPRRVGEDGLEHAIEITWRTANDAEDLGSCCLLLQRFAQFAAARLEFSLVAAPPGS